MDPQSVQKLIDTIAEQREQMTQQSDQIASLVTALQANVNRPVNVQVQAQAAQVDANAQ